MVYYIIHSIVYTTQRNFRKPSRNGVFGLYPKSSSSGVVSANVTGTSPGCIGTKLFVSIEIVIKWQYSCTNQFFLKDSYEIKEILW